VRTIGLATERQTRRVTALSVTQAAWVAALPTALVMLLVIAVAAPPLGHAFLGPGPERFWPHIVPQPEPVEHARYLLSLLGPIALAAIVLATLRRPLRTRPQLARGWVLATQVVLLAFAALCFAAQHNVLVSADQPGTEHTRYFTYATLALALAAPLAALVLSRRAELATRAAALARETGARRIGAALVAIALTIVWLLTAIDADGSLANTARGVAGHILWSMDEPFAILNGRTPLVNFHAQYGQLVPYLAAATMALFGASIGTFTITMTACSGLALLALYATLRRITRSSLFALALYAPLLATGFYMKLGPLEDRYGPANLFSLWPTRYGGPYLLAWLLTRHLDGAAPRRPWILFLLAGLVLINNPEFGVGALAALAVALVAVQPPRSRAAAGRLLAEAAGGLGGAVALVVLGTLLRSGSLPHFGWALEFSRLYGVGGWALVLMPRVGLYLVVYMTFTAALVLAAVRVARREPDVLLTALLAWSGVFGLLAGAYYAGRSHPQVLIDLFSPWALSLALLTIAAVRSLAGRGWRRPQLPELAVLFGFGLTVCSLAQTPTPWSQLARIRDDAPVALFKQPRATTFIAERTSPGEKIGILIPLGHRIAYDIGRVNVAPYASIESMPTVQQLARAIAVLRAEGADQLFVSARFNTDEETAALQQAGYVVRAQTTEELGAPIAELIDSSARSRP